MEKPYFLMDDLGGKKKKLFLEGHPYVFSRPRRPASSSSYSLNNAWHRIPARRVVNLNRSRLALTKDNLDGDPRWKSWQVVSVWYIMLLDSFFEDQAEIRKCWLGKNNGENEDPKVMIGTWNKSEMDSWRRIYSTQETKILNSDGMGFWGNLPNGQAKREQNQKLRKVHNNMMTLVGFFCIDSL